MSAANLIFAVEIWLGIGAVVAVLFIVAGLDKVEPNAQGGYVFRVLILPGLCLLWPIVLWRWRLAASGAEDWRERHSPQRKSAGFLGFAMAAGLFLILATAVLFRPGADAPPPQKIGAVDPVGPL